MKIIKNITQLRSVIKKYRREDKSIGFVPTMGYFHEGHLSLMRKAKKDNDICVVSIYVNPVQFNSKKDLNKYPRDLKRDSSMLNKENVDILFVPSNNDVYPNSYLTYIDVEKISSVSEGKFRPGHFRGVATIVTKLLNIVQPNTMYLGAKDAQQVIVLQRMVEDLNIPVVIKVVETKREADGLAMSSRNKFLSFKDRQEAVVLYQALSEARKLIKSGERSAAKVISLIRKLITTKSSGRIQYVQCVNVKNLETLKKLNGEILIALAVYFGTTRLIDNVKIKIHDPKQSKN